MTMEQPPPVIARSGSDEAIQSLFIPLDCFAPLAMTMEPTLAMTVEGYAALKPATALTSRYSSRPNFPHSRPLPDCL
jgi:hypothetical protein